MAVLSGRDIRSLSLFADPNDEVEKTCHRVIVDMESTLGESLQDYFNN